MRFLKLSKQNRLVAGITLLIVMIIGFWGYYYFKQVGQDGVAAWVRSQKGACIAEYPPSWVYKLPSPFSTIVKSFHSTKYTSVYLTNVENGDTFKKLAMLEDLQKIRVHGVPVDSLADIKHLSQLRELTISRTNIKDISALKNFQNLEYLNLGSHRVLDWGTLRLLPKLKTLRLGNVDTAKRELGGSAIKISYGGQVKCQSQ
jgi:hypothetical protein